MITTPTVMTATLPVLWTMAVLGEAIVKTGDVSGVEVTLDRIMQYYDSATKAFLASPNDGVEVYSDDNAQLAWVFIDAFKMTGQQKYLDHAKDIVLYIRRNRVLMVGLSGRKIRIILRRFRQSKLLWLQLGCTI